MSIKSLEIRRFKRLERFDLSNIRPVSILIGANNSGKSSVLQALHFAVAVAQTSKVIDSVNWRADKYELSFSPSQLLYSPVGDVMTLGSGGLLVEDTTKRIEVMLTDSAGRSCAISVRRGRNKNVQVALEGRELGEILQDLNSPYTVYAPGLAGIARHEQLMSLGLVKRIAARGDANLALRNILLHLKKQKDAWNGFMRDLRNIFPHIDIRIAFNESVDEHIDASFSLGDEFPWLPIDAAGTAILQSVQLLSYVALFNPKILILDEPDSHLHPDNQRKLTELVEGIAVSRGIQIFVSTHSRHVIDATTSTTSEVVWLNDGVKVETQNSEVSRRLLDLGALDSLDYFANGATKYIFASEDSNTAALETILEANGYDLEETKIAPYHGCTKLESAIVLGSFLKQHAREVRFIVHLDRDYMSDDEVNAYRTSLEAEGLELFVTKGNDIETHFLNPAHLAALNPGASVETCAAVLAEAIQDSKDESIKAIVETRLQRANKRRGVTGESVSPGDIAIQASRDYESDSSKYTKGKPTLKAVKRRLQAALRTNPRIESPSDHLKDETLRQLRSLAG